MDEGFIFGRSHTIWDVDDNENVNIGIGTCRDLLVVPIYGPYGVDNCIVVLIEVMNEDREQIKLFRPIPSVRYFKSMVGIEVFWPCKYLLMNDEEVVRMRNQCHIIMDGVNNLSNKQVSCKVTRSLTRSTLKVEGHAGTLGWD